MKALVFLQIQSSSPQGCRFGPESSRQTLVSPICRSLRNHLWRIVSENVEGTNLQPRPPPKKKKKKKIHRHCPKAHFPFHCLFLARPISFGGPKAVFFFSANQQPKGSKLQSSSLAASNFGMICFFRDRTCGL